MIRTAPLWGTAEPCLLHLWLPRQRHGRAVCDQLAERVIVAQNTDLVWAPLNPTMAKEFIEVRAPLVASELGGPGLTMGEAAPDRIRIWERLRRSLRTSLWPVN